MFPTPRNNVPSQHSHWAHWALDKVKIKNRCYWCQAYLCTSWDDFPGRPTKSSHMGGMIWTRAHLGPGPFGLWPTWPGPTWALAHLGLGPLGPWPTWALGPLGPWPTWAQAQVVTRHRGSKATRSLYTIFQIGKIIPPRWDDLATAGMISSHLWQSSQLAQSYAFGAFGGALGGAITLHQCC